MHTPFPRPKAMNEALEEILRLIIFCSEPRNATETMQEFGYSRAGWGRKTAELKKFGFAFEKERRTNKNRKTEVAYKINFKNSKITLFHQVVALVYSLSPTPKH